MAVWTIVPVKPLRRGKSRLSSVLDAGHREALNHCLLENTLEVLKSIKVIENILVVSRDPRALTLARSLNVRTIQESGTPALNQALERATLFAKRFAVESVLIVPADIPLLNSLDIEAVVEAGKRPPVVVLAPDRHRRGTNVMLVSPPGLFQYRYGENSFFEHTRLAQSLGSRIEICERPSLALDLDLPEDLDLIRKQVNILKNGNFINRINSISEVKPGENGNNIANTHPCIEMFRTIQLGDESEKPS